MSNEEPSVVVIPPNTGSETSGLTQFIDEGRSAVVSTYDSALHNSNAAASRFKRFRDTGSAHFSATMARFHEKRHEKPWTMVGSAALASGLLALPFGRGTGVRCGIFGGLVALCVVNPEYVYDVYRNYISPRYRK